MLFSEQEIRIAVRDNKKLKATQEALRELRRIFFSTAEKLQKLGCKCDHGLRCKVCEIINDSARQVEEAVKDL